MFKLQSEFIEMRDKNCIKLISRDRGIKRLGFWIGIAFHVICSIFFSFLFNK